MSTTSPRTISLCIGLFLLSSLLTWSWQHRRPARPLTHLGDLSSSSSSSSSNGGLARPRLAFATFLANNANPDRAASDALSAELLDNDDGYFLGTRVLAYQLLHSAVTGTNLSVPLIVLATPDVSSRKLARLRADGADVRVAPTLRPQGWEMRPGSDRWRDVLAKLRLWDVLDGEFDKVCFMDGDTLVTRRLDDVFFDEATLVRPTKPDPAGRVQGEADLPSSYMFATHVESFGYDHEWPPPPPRDAEDGGGGGGGGGGTYFNVGFFCFRPDRKMYNYYLSLLAEEGKFDTTFPEQNLLNYAHRREGGGNMPWTRLWEGWNVNWPTERDWRRGVASFHAKYWDADPGHDPTLKQIWREQRAEMEGFWRGRELREGRVGGTLGEGL